MPFVWPELVICLLAHEMARIRSEIWRADRHKQQFSIRFEDLQLCVKLVMPGTGTAAATPALVFANVLQSFLGYSLHSPFYCCVGFWCDLLRVVFLVRLYSSRALPGTYSYHVCVVAQFRAV